jgi:hypothetical protein
MGRSRVTSSHVPPCSLRNALAGAVLLAAAGLAGCGDVCYGGFFNNTGLTINFATPESACNLTKAKGEVRAAVAKAGSCESCAAGARVQHICDAARHTTSPQCHR